MRRILKILSFLALFGLPYSVSALTVAGNDTVYVAETTTIEDVYAAGGGTIDLGGIFNNDVFIGGGNITLSGPVKGDLFVGGGTVRVTGPVDGSIRATGGTIDIEGRVGRNVLAIGGSVTIGDQADVVGEVMIFSGSSKINGHVAKAVNIWGGSTLIHGKLDGDVNVHTGDDCGKDPCVTIGPAAVVGGALSYWAASEASVHADSQVKEIVFHPFDTRGNQRALQTIFSGFALWSLLSSLLVGLLLSWLAPRTVRRVAEQMIQRFWPSVGLGALILFVVPIAIVVLCVTFIGIPAGLILLAAYLIDLYIAHIFLGYVVGRYLWRPRATGSEPTRGRTILITLLGVFVVAVVSGLLFSFGAVGGFFGTASLVGVVQLALLMWSLGALVTVKWKMVREQG